MHPFIRRLPAAALATIALTTVIGCSTGAITSADPEPEKTVSAPAHTPQTETFRLAEVPPRTAFPFRDRPVRSGGFIYGHRTSWEKTSEGPRFSMAVINGYEGVVRPLRVLAVVPDGCVSKGWTYESEAPDDTQRFYFDTELGYSGPTPPTDQDWTENVLNGLYEVAASEWICPKK